MRLFSFAFLLLLITTIGNAQSPGSVNDDASIRKQQELFDKYFKLTNDKEDLSLKMELGMDIMKINMTSRYARYAAIWGEMLVNLKEMSDTTTAKAEALVREFPDFAQAWYLQGELLYYMKSNDCVEKMQRCIELNPALGAPYFFLADFYARQNNPKLAVRYYDLLEKADSTHKSVYYNRANEKTKLKDLAGAIEDYGKVKPGSGNYPKALFNRGYIYLTQQDYAKAEPDFDHFLQLMPDYAAGYYYRGYARYYTQGKEPCCADMKTALSKGYPDAQSFLDKYCQ